MKHFIQFEDLIKGVMTSYNMMKDTDIQSFLWKKKNKSFEC